MKFRGIFSSIGIDLFQTKILIILKQNLLNQLIYQVYSDCLNN